MTRVLIALAEPIMEAGLERIIDDSDDLTVVGSHPNLEGIRDRALETSADVVIVDVHFRRQDPALVPDLASAGSRVLVLVDHSVDECALRAALGLEGRAGLSEEALAALDECCLTSLRHSASGCMARGATPDIVLETLRTVSRGEIAAAPWLSAMAGTGLGGLGPSNGGGPRPVTARELEVMSMVAKGLSNKGIARELGLKEQTVKNHLAHMMEKLGLRSRLDVGMFAVKHNVHVGDPMADPVTDGDSSSAGD
ncbi:MAG: response regulator transcription factor [Gemmatimonadetes bacterium]|nr:response regulator transcription factor [Gemmatimonadota bacterium]